MAEAPERFWISRARLEALVDGIFAIAMTLLILEIRVPELESHRSPDELLLAVAHLGPALFSYVLSFAMLAIFWYRHHRVIHLFRRVDLPLFLFTPCGYAPIPVLVAGLVALRLAARRAEARG